MAVGETDQLRFAEGFLRRNVSFAERVLRRNASFGGTCPSAKRVLRRGVSFGGSCPSAKRVLPWRSCFFPAKRVLRRNGPAPYRRRVLRSANGGSQAILGAPPHVPTMYLKSLFILHESPSVASEWSRGAGARPRTQNSTTRRRPGHKRNSTTPPIATRSCGRLPPSPRAAQPTVRKKVEACRPVKARESKFESKFDNASP